MDYYDEIHSDEMHTREKPEKRTTEKTKLVDEVKFSVIADIASSIDDWISNSSMIELANSRRNEKIINIIIDSLNKNKISVTN